MKAPNRGAFLSPIRVLAALLSVVSASFALSSCVSRGELAVVDDPPEPHDAPAGCSATMCDYFYTSCTDPCTECWQICESQDDEQSVVRCTGICAQICSPSNKPTPVAQCEEERATCRSTRRNTVCVDTLRDEQPKGQPPCSAQMNEANCRCGSDETCLGALDRLNTKCRKCNAAWLKPCLDAACKTEMDDALACLNAQGCTGLNDCAGCETKTSVLTTCFQNAQQDPRDIGGCYSKPRACWGEPICPYALY
jgi:hypothetical protein